jgi:hypothetical protein
MVRDGVYHCRSAHRCRSPGYAASPTIRRFNTNVGDIIIEDGEITGDGVSSAAPIGGGGVSLRGSRGVAAVAALPGVAEDR